MMRSFAPLVAAMLGLALSACATPAELPTRGVSGVPDRGASAQRVDLTGKWMVHEIGGNTLTDPIAFTGKPDSLTWEPACAAQSISYRATGDMIEFYQPAATDAERIACLIGYPQDVPRVLDALEGQWALSSAQEGAVVLSRADSRIVLQPASVQPPLTLAGEWRVARLDGKPFDEPYRIALSGDDREIGWEPRCARQTVSYLIRGNRFAIAEPPRGGEVLPTCRIGLPERLPDVMSAIRAADRIERTSSNGIELSGNGRSVTLFSQ